MASNPPGHCCTSGFQHEGEPVGSMINIADGIHAYLASPTAGREKKHSVALLYIPDIMGVWQNAKLLADQYAARGYICLVPDIFLGDPVPINRPDDFDVKKWIMQGSDGSSPHTPDIIDAVVKEAILYLTSQHGVVKLGAIGICIGAKYVARHFSSGIAVGFIAHPAFMEEVELETITGPLSLAAAENDYIFTAEKRHKSEEILSNKTPTVPYQICLYSGTAHGFAVRCDLSIPEQRYAKEQAFLQAVNWFDEYLLG